MSPIAIAALVIFIGAYGLIASEKIPRVIAALGGAALMILIHATGAEEVFFSEETGIDWNVIFLLFGMMIIVGVLRKTGVFEYLAIWAAQQSKAQPFRMMTLLVLITAVASAMLDNVTTVLLVAPVTLLVCERLEINPIPFLLAEVMASNIGGAATLIGDPPNIIIGSRADLNFNDFLIHMGPIVVVLLVIFVGLSWLLWGRKLHIAPEKATELLALKPADAITDSRLLKLMGVVLLLVLVGFTTHSVHHMEPSLIAMLGGGAAALLAHRKGEGFLDDVEWETLTFFAGLFIMVGALVHTGVIGALAEFLKATIGDNHEIAAMGLLVGSALLSGIVDNIPYVATMSPLVLDLVGTGAGADPGSQSLWWALALGADLGGNATAVGASANVVVLGIAKRNGHPISFMHFTKYGLIVTAVTIAACIPYVLLRYFILA